MVPRPRVLAAVATALLACGDPGGRDDGATGWPTTIAASTNTPPGTSDEGHDATSDDDAGDDDGSSSGEGGTSSDSGAVGTFPNIARITRTPSLGDGAGGTWTIDEAALAEIGHAFYAEHPDAFDFLAVYTEAVLQDIGAFAYTVRYDIGGIGFDGYDPGITPAMVGSAGQLAQINVMNAPEDYADPNDASILIHETTHRWSAFIEVPGTPAPAFLLDDSWAHFNIHVHTGGPSATGYGDLVDLGGGSFRFTLQYPLQLSPLELYLAGMIGPAEVGPLFYVRDAYGYDPATPVYSGAWGPATYHEDATYSGVRVDFTIDDVVAGNGVRTPAAGTAQTHFRFAFVLVCSDAAACDPAQLQRVEAQRVAFESQFADATDGRGSIDAAL